jgi:hypothetical protein
MFDQPIDLLHCNIDISIVSEINLSRGLLLRSNSFFEANRSSFLAQADWRNFSLRCGMFEAAPVGKTSSAFLASSEDTLTSDHRMHYPNEAFYP